jgi:hypothetical protein
MSVCDVPVIAEVCATAGQAAASVAVAPFAYLADAMAGTAAFLLEAMWQAFHVTTVVDLTSGQLVPVYNILFGVAIVLTLGFFLLQVMRATLRREPAALTRAVVGMAKSVLGSFVALTLLAAALEVVDQLCLGIVAATGTTVEQMGERLGLLVAGLAALNVGAPGVGAIVTIFLAGLAIAGILLVWVSLLVRKALLLVAIVFAPIALAGSAWDHTRAWASRWAMAVLALIVSKLVLVVIFLLATTQVAAPIDADLASVADPLAGVVLMVVAGFAPYLTYKAISFVGFDTHQSVSLEQEAKHALDRPVPLPAGLRDSSRIRKVLDAAPTPPTAGGTPPVPAPAASTGTAATPSPAVGGAAAAAGPGAAWAAPAAAAALTGARAATSGPQSGASLAAQAAGQADAAGPPTTPPGPVTAAAPAAPRHVTVPRGDRP